MLKKIFDILGNNIFSKYILFNLDSDQFNAINWVKIDILSFHIHIDHITFGPERVSLYSRFDNFCLYRPILDISFYLKRKPLKFSYLPLEFVWTKVIFL